jgi:hypothetical protein
VAGCVHCRTTTPQGRIARQLASTASATAPGQVLMFDLVHVAGLEKKPQQPAPAVNAVKANTKPSATQAEASKSRPSTEGEQNQAEQDQADTA